MINIKIENNIKLLIKYWNLINTKLIDSIINIYSWILSFYLKLNCEYVMLQCRILSLVMRKSFTFFFFKKLIAKIFTQLGCFYINGNS